MTAVSEGNANQLTMVRQGLSDECNKKARPRGRASVVLMGQV
jgi:hypothetical protein